MTESDHDDLGRPSTPSDCGQVSNSSDFFEIKFEVQLKTISGYNIGKPIPCDQDTSAGHLVRMIKERCKSKDGSTRSEKDIHLIIGHTVVDSEHLTTKVWSLCYEVGQEMDQPVTMNVCLSEKEEQDPS